MTEKELLELAAKAAGYIVESYTEDGAWVYVDGSSLNADGEYPIFLWRPKVDDGDALRLAVKLRINIVHKGVGAYTDLKEREIATRRAIFRAAAAEIGKAMP